MARKHVSAAWIVTTWWAATGLSKGVHCASLRSNLLPSPRASPSRALQAISSSTQRRDLQLATFSVSSIPQPTISLEVAWSGPRRGASGSARRCDGDHRRGAMEHHEPSGGRCTVACAATLDRESACGSGAIPHPAILSVGGSTEPSGPAVGWLPYMVSESDSFCPTGACTTPTVPPVWSRCHVYYSRSTAARKG